MYVIGVDLILQPILSGALRNNMVILRVNILKTTEKFPVRFDYILKEQKLLKAKNKYDHFY